MYKSRLLIAVVIAVFLLLLIPVFALVIGISLFPSLGTTSYSLVDFLTMPSTLSLVESTLEFSIVSAVFTTIFAVFYAWFIARTDVYGKRFLELLPVLGLSVPLLFKAFAWSFLANRNSGIINTILSELLGKGVLSFNINTMAGIIFAQSFTNIPLAYLVILPAMKSMDANLEEASRIAGKGILATFRDVTFPIVRPAVFSAFVLAVIGGVGTLEYPFVLGGPGRIHVLATEVLFWAQERVPPAYGTAGEFSILYAAITFVAVTIYIWSTRRAFKFQVVTGRSVSHSAQKLGRFRYVALLICFVIVFFEFILPFITLFLVSTSNIYGSGLENVKFNFPVSYVNALEIPGLFPSLKISIEFGVIAATVATIVGSLLSYAAYKVKSRGSRLAEYISALPLAFPGVVYGVALFWTFLLVPGLHTLYGTIWPLVISLIFIRLPFTTRIVSGNMVQVSSELEEASQVSGSGFLRTFTRILLPLTRAGIFNSFIYTFIDSLRELGGVIILATSQSMTFTVLLLHFYNTASLFTDINVVAAGSVIFTGIITLFLVMASLVRYYLDRRQGT
jgi:iron(III) transport system permease protein